MSAESLIGSFRRGTWRKLRGSRRFRWTSATFPPGTPTGSRCGRPTSSAYWPAVGELAVPTYRGREVIGLAQDGTGVDVELAGGQVLRAEYLVGCDGRRSVIRKAAGITFPGWDPTTSYLIAEVEMALETISATGSGSGREPEWGIRHDAIGVTCRSASVTRRVTSSISAMARSAVGSISESGTLVSQTPCRSQAIASKLSKPLSAPLMMRRRGQAARDVSSTRSAMQARMATASPRVPGPPPGNRRVGRWAPQVHRIPANNPAHLVRLWCHAATGQPSCAPIR